MLKVISIYLKTVMVAPLIFGALGLAFTDPTTAAQASARVFVFSAIVLGPFLLGGIINHLPLARIQKVFVWFFSSLIISVAAAAIYYLVQPMAAEQLIVAGWGNNAESYRQYPINGFQLIGLCVFILYGLMSLVYWGAPGISRGTRNK